MRLMTRPTQHKRQINNGLFAIKALIGSSLIASVLFTSGCATSTSIKVNKAPQANLNNQNSQYNSEAEFIFKYLVAEVAGQRGDLATSSQLFYELAKTSQDANLAERAAKVAAYGRVPGVTVPAIQLWSELNPASN